jgi:hypothetical protein
MPTKDLRNRWSYRHSQLRDVGTKTTTAALAP